MLHRPSFHRALWLLAAFAVLAYGVATMPALAGSIDAPVAHILGGHGEWWQVVALVFTFFGSSVGIALGVVSVIAAFPTAQVTARLLVAVGGTAAVANYLKLFFERARPLGAELYIADGTSSFPSAHAATAMALYGFVACLYVIRFRSRADDTAVLTLAGVFITLIGISRIVLGVHYATDVLGGWLLGGGIRRIRPLAPASSPVALAGTAVHSLPSGRWYRLRA